MRPPYRRPPSRHSEDVREGVACDFGGTQLAYLTTHMRIYMHTHTYIHTYIPISLPPPLLIVRHHHAGANDISSKPYTLA